MRRMLPAARQEEVAVPYWDGNRRRLKAKQAKLKCTAGEVSSRRWDTSQSLYGQHPEQV